MITKNDILTKKTTQMVENQAVSSTFTLFNDYDGDIYTFTNLQNVLLKLSSNDIKEWFLSRDFIPNKSNFIIEEKKSNGATKKILKIKASKLFNL
jgi:hypothetical protein